MRTLGFNPLIRLTDRLEVLAMLAVLGVALIAFPVAAQTGKLIHDSGVRAAADQAQSRHPVHAQVVGDSGLLADVEGPACASVQWHEGSRVRTEQVVSPGTVRAGDPLTIWLDDKGKVVGAPLTVADADVNAFAVTGTVWTALVLGSALAAFFFRRGLDRSRARCWERELLLLAHNDDGWANR